MIDQITSYGIGELFTYFIERKLKLTLPINSKTRWKWNIKSEIRFWDKCIKSNGLIWPEEYKLRHDPELNLQQEIVELLPEEKEINVLDVGAGPFTYLGKKYSKAKIKITAVDPLAEEYDRIMKKYNVTPIIRTKKLEAEKLTTMFSNDSFDFVFARNCIDHSYSPEKSILEMIKVIKINHYILLKHVPNEAEKEDWQGLHQWNFSNNGNDFIISSKTDKINFSEKYKNICVTVCTYIESDDMLNVTIKKVASV
jgi:ubiquinone/menaquinone biosynthesis C-methylase UbiE